MVQQTTFTHALAVAAAVVSLLCIQCRNAGAQYVWVEGEKPSRAAVTRHPWWYDQVKRNLLSGGDMISNWGEKPGEVEYEFTAPKSGAYDFWVRANPVATRLSYALNGGPLTPIDIEKNQTDTVNIAADDKIDLRFLAWIRVGTVSLKQGANSVRFRMDSQNNNHGMLDCFVFSAQPFVPHGTLKPDQAAQDSASAGDAGWFAFAPAEDRFGADSGFDLRSLNEKTAGDGGFIAVKDGRFVHGKTGEPVRFWAVNGPPADLRDRAALRRAARLLAKYGVNLVRVHGGYFDRNGAVNPQAVQHAIDIVETMKEEGIYTHFSIYFPLWLRPAADSAVLPGYDGSKNPFAALYFNKAFQEQYRSWWKALLTTPSAVTGRRLIDEPAVFGAEIINEDSFFFWTFSTENLPDPELRMLERQFGAWLQREFGSIQAAMARWKGVSTPRDAPAEGRMGFRPLWNVFHDKTQRDKDTVRFLVEVQRGFYRDTYRYLRDLGFKGVITASNWTTASPEVLGPIEKYTYTVTDFLDRHGYFGCLNKGEEAAWSLRNGQTYADRSALRFDAEEPGKPKLFVHPVMDVHYDDKPSMISEIAWTRPNRYRSEQPLFLSVYGALQGSDAIVQFALDSVQWVVKPGYFMQPWTMMSPGIVGQFPAAALIYRKGLVAEGDTLVDLNLKVQDILDLKGTPLAQEAALDELRLKDVPQGPAAAASGNPIDPLVHFCGRTTVRFTDAGGPARVADLSRLIDRPAQQVRSSTGQLRLDYGKGVLTIDAPAAQGVSGNLKAAGTVETRDLTVSSPMEIGHIVAVSLDGKPLATSGRILLQVMSEERASGFRSEPAGGGVQRIADIGHDPWRVRDLAGVVRIKRSDAAELRVTALDQSGYPAGAYGTGSEVKLKPDVVYYLLSK